MGSITNKYDLPQPIVKMLTRHPYSRGDSHISVSELITAPQIAVLKRRHANDITEDVSDRVWSLMGTNIHKILEDAVDENHTPEERIFTDVGGWRVSGQMDLQKNGESVIVTDWKFTSVWSAMYPKSEWEAQVNLYVHLVESVKLIPVSSAQVVAILRDWRKSMGVRTKNYPVAPIVRVPVRIWPFDQRQAYLEQRVAAHQAAAREYDWTGKLPECTDEDRWVRKKGEDGIRCRENYCSVSQYCKQYQPKDK